MVTPTAAPFLPARLDLPELRAAAGTCRGCELYEHADQTVFGAGSAGAAVMLVGEQPGDTEDREGTPFVGPAGRLLDRALAEAGIDRSAAYLTNAVKHFRFKSTDTGKRRIHEKPATRHIEACRPWLTAELTAVVPRVVVAMGAVAAGSLLGNGFRVTKDRGQLLVWPPATGPFAGNDLPIQAVMGTIHPSAILRTRGARERDAAFDGLVADLRTVACAIARASRTV